MLSPKAKPSSCVPLPPLTEQEVQSLRQDAQQAGRRLREIAAMTTAEQAELKKHLQRPAAGLIYSPMKPEGLINPHDPNQPGAMTDDSPSYGAP